MPRRVTLTKRDVTIDDIKVIATYHQDTETALRLFFSPANPHLPPRLMEESPSKLNAELEERLAETDLRSALAILFRLEAAFRVDFCRRCQEKKRDPVSRAFRDLKKTKGSKVRLDDDIFEIWRKEYPELSRLISELAGAFNFRHLHAHGNYWTPKLGRKYDYRSVYYLADSVLTNFKFIWTEA